MENHHSSRIETRTPRVIKAVVELEIEIKERPQHRHLTNDEFKKMAFRRITRTLGTQVVMRNLNVQGARITSWSYDKGNGKFEGVVG